MRLQAKASVITGTASGIGRATALRFAAEGADVLIVDRDADGADETVRLEGVPSIYSIRPSDRGILQEFAVCVRFVRTD